jgi:hypothetical protein
MYIEWATIDNLLHFMSGANDHVSRNNLEIVCKPSKDRTAEVLQRKLMRKGKRNVARLNVRQASDRPTGDHQWYELTHPDHVVTADVQRAEKRDKAATRRPR